MLGPAFTVSQPAGHNDWLHRAIYQAPPGSVLVVATGDRGYGYWGELMALAARARPLRGVVIDGGVRDVVGLEATGLPVFASAVCLRGTLKTPSAGGSLGSPIAIGDATVTTGDLVAGDADGVVVIPASRLAGLVELALQRERREAEMQRAIEGGRRLLDLVIPAR